MTLDELKEWMKSHKVVDWDVEYDGQNRLSYVIYECDEGLFRVDFCNKHPSEKWISEKGYMRGVYEPYKVRKIERTVVIKEYVKV